MAFTTGTITVRSRVYDMTGTDSYDPDEGTDLGPVGDLVLAKLERDVVTYPTLRSGSTPSEAAIFGEGLILEFSLNEYDAAVVNMLAQRVRPSGQNNNFHGFGAGDYKLGHLLSGSETLSLLVADEDSPNDYPALYIPRAVIVDVESMSLSMIERSVMTPATFRVVGLWDEAAGGAFNFGSIAGFPSLGA